MIKLFASIFLTAALVSSAAAEFVLPKAYEPWPDQSKWRKAAEAPGYARQVAHAPDFSDKAVWPYTTGKEAYATQKWTKGRVYVWAHPGESSVKRGAGDTGTVHDLMSPLSWLEDGQPPKEVIFDENTDVVLPAAEKSYVVNTKPLGAAQILRHVTIGKNAFLHGGGDGLGRRFFGNVWIQRGGQLYAQSRTLFSGDASTFLRNDNSYDLNTDRKAEMQRISQYMGVNKPAGASVEAMGLVDVLDEFGIDGLLIIGPDSRVHPGRNAKPLVSAKGTIALMDGAFFGSWTNNFETQDLVLQGTLQGGLPDRPLTRNAYAGVHFKNWTNTQYEGPDALKSSRDGKLITVPPVPSIQAEAGSVMRSYTADPTKARLVITFYGEIGFEDMPYSPDDMPKELVKNAIMQKEAHGKAFAKSPGMYEWAKKLPRGITIWCGEGVVIDTVAIDHVHKGGLQASPATRANWKNVAFGQSNHAAGDALFADPPKLTKR